MKFTSTQTNLYKGISVVEKIISKNFNLPILQNILVKCEQDKPFVKLAATDLEVGVEVEVPAAIEVGGSTTIPAKLFGSFIKALPNDNIEVAENNKSVSVKCLNHKSVIRTESPDEFPLMPTIKNPIQFSIKGTDFSLGIISVGYSVSNLDIKPEISGICVKFLNNELCFAATDSFRLAEKKISKPNNPNDAKITTIKELIMPQKTCELISRIFGDEEEMLTFELEENQFLVKNNPENTGFLKTKLISRLIDGEYPDYEQIIPKSFSTSIEVSREDLISHIRRASLFSSKINDIILEVNPQKQELVFVSKDQDCGEYQSSLPCAITGDKLRVSFNYNYLIDGLLIITSPSIKMELNHETTPVLVTPTEMDGFRYVVMPIRA